MEVDEALSSLGKYGKWQMLTYTMVCLSVTVSGCWHMMVIVFAGGEPTHHCKLLNGESVNESIPLELNAKGKGQLSSCEKYINISIDNSTTVCDNGWYYDPEYDATIVTEWDLVCDQNYLVETSQSVFNFGVMVGAIIFTTLADKIGRKPVHLGCQWAMVVIGFAIAFSPNYIVFVILRFLLGAVREGAGLVGIVMACELFPASERTFAGAALELFWASAWMMLALLAYLITNWRYLQLAITLPPIITIVEIWLLPESVPWLAANKQIEAAEIILRNAAKYNGITLAEPILKRPEAEESNESIPLQDCDLSLKNNSDHSVIEKKGSVQSVRECILKQNDTNNQNSESQITERKNVAVVHKSKHKPTEDEVVPVLEDALHPIMPKKNKVFRYFCNIWKRENKFKERYEADLEHRYTCFDLLNSRKVMIYTFVMCSLWFASGVIYFGLSLSTSTLAGDKYINFFLSGAVEAPAYLMTVFVLQRFGRRYPLCAFHIIAGVVLFANIFIPDETASGTKLVPLTITLTMIGKFAMTAAFGTVVLYAPEIYPTNLRNFGFGLASVWGRIGGMIAPFAAYVGKIMPWVPGVVFAIVAIITGVMTLILPETLNRPLPVTIEEIENWKNPSVPVANAESKKIGTIREKHCKRSKDELDV